MFGMGSEQEKRKDKRKKKEKSNKGNTAISIRYYN